MKIDQFFLHFEIDILNYTLTMKPTCRILHSSWVNTGKCVRVFLVEDYLECGLDSMTDTID